MTPVRLLLAGCLAVGVLTSTASSTVAAPGGPGASRAIVQQVNAVRAQHGLRALRYSPRLAASATRYSRRMVRLNYFGHSGRIQASSRFSPVGEVLANHRGWAPRVAATVRRWCRSPSHRALLLHPAFGYAGGGPAFGRSGRRRTTAWTMHLGGR